MLFTSRQSTNCTFATTVKAIAKKTSNIGHCTCTCIDALQPKAYTKHAIKFTYYIRIHVHNMHTCIHI